MTVEEAFQRYGAKRTMTLVGDNIYALSRRIYGSDTEQAMLILRVLNPSITLWVHLEPGVEVFYLDPSVLNNILY